MNKLIIKLKKSTLRPICMSDAESIARNANNKKVARNLTAHFPYPYKLADSKKWIRFLLSKKSKNELVFGIEVDAEIIGSIGLYKKRPHSRMLGYWIGEDYWNRGIMTEVVKTITRLAFKDHKVKRVSARVYTDNQGSYRVLKKSGFLHEGTLLKEEKIFGKFRDTHILAKVR